MDITATLARFDRQLRRAAVLPDPAYRLERLPDVTRVVGPTAGPQDNIVLWSGLDATTADAAIRREVAYFGRWDRSFEWKLFEHDTPADLSDRLRAHGLVAEPRETMLALDLAGALPPPTMLGAVAIERVQDPARLAAIDQRDASVYPGRGGGMVQALAQELAAAPDRLSIYLAMAGDRCVSAGWVRFNPGTDFADMWGGATVPEWRGRGIYRALVAIRAAEAKARGASVLTVDASDASRPILERLGFVRLTTTTPFLWRPR